ncbi:DUF7144 family membrane protein [Nocardia noduli]|uniref:DUF7144 family membrane protein n=1 Tax=Nocardia noduli TaxID=2815722 RepID=UPI001C23201B|nr:hypothetical protein [Nocardia noduli]
MTAPDNRHVRQGLAAGTSIGAAILLMVLGIVSLLQGISAVAEDEVFVTGIDYIYEFDLTTWGWIHIVLGALIIVCALALVTGTAWGRGAAIGFASLSILANFLWLPYYPLWSVLLIVLDVVVIWAVVTWRPQR